MILYIIKSSLCLFILVGFYKAFLEQTNLHTLKRGYLLFAVIGAITIPLITFTTYLEPINNPSLSNELMVNGTLDGTVEETTLNSSNTYYINYWPTILWSIYFAGVVLFSIRFFRNLFTLLNRIRINQKEAQKSLVHVLLQEMVIPHTFFKYVFVNKYKFEENAIPKEVLLHEQAHAREKHSLDIVLVELYQLVFWFNPLILILKRAMKLNHEFMADAAVLRNGADQKNYQELLLQYSSNQESYALANAFNYSSIKKRFTVMKTQTSNQSKWIKTLLLIPLLAFVVYGFSNKEEVYKDVSDISLDASDYTARSITISIEKNGSFIVENEFADRNSLVAVVNKFHQDISPEVRNRIMNIHVTSDYDVSEADTWFLFESLKPYGFHRMVTPNEEIVKSKGNTPVKTSNNFASPRKHLIIQIELNELRVNGIPSTLSTFSEDIDRETKDWEETDYTSIEANILIASSTHDFLNAVDSEFQKTHYAKANEGVKIAKKNSSKGRNGASKEQMERYNKLASYYNKALKKDRGVKIKMKDVEQLKYIYSLMTKKQKASAEPFPDFPKPPPPPDSPKAPQAVKGEAVIPPPPPPLSEDATPVQKKKYAKALEEYNKKYKVVKGRVTENPPPPPPPKSEKVKSPSKKSKSQNDQVETGFIKINKQPHYFVTVNNKTKFYNSKGYEVSESGKIISKSQVNASDVIPGQYITKVYSRNKVMIQFNDNKKQKIVKKALAHIPDDADVVGNPQLPENPKPPKDPLDHVIEMAKKGAKFYVEDKQVSADEAISVLKKNRSINIQTSNTKSKSPIVKISTKPIQVVPNYKS